MTTQSISYRDGKHMHSLSIDMNDPADVEFMEQFKRVPSRNRDYIATLYAREKKRGINRHIGDTIQPLSLVRQIDNIDMQKSSLNIDKNALQSSLEYIDKRTKELNQEIANEQDAKKRAGMEAELKSLTAEREKIKARADELGIKIAALNVKSSADSTSPLKPDQLITIIKKLQGEGNGVDLSSVLTKIENIRSDQGGMLDYIAALADTIDKLFTYSNGRELNTTKRVVKGITLLNKVLSERVVSGNKTQVRDAIVSALEYASKLSKLSKNDITTRVGVDMNEYISGALYRRLIDSMLMAIDFDFKDVPKSAFNKENIDTPRTRELLADIHKRVGDSLYTDTVKEAKLGERLQGVYKGIASSIMGAINAAIDANNRVKVPADKGSYTYHIVGAVMGIEPLGTKSDVAVQIYGTRDALVGLYEKYTETTGDKSNVFADTAKYIKQNVASHGNNYTKTVVEAAFHIVGAVLRAMSRLASSTYIGVQYLPYENTIAFTSRTKEQVELRSYRASPIFAIDRPEGRKNILELHPAISEQDIINIIRNVYTRSNAISNRISASEHNIDIPEKEPERAALSTEDAGNYEYINDAEDVSPVPPDEKKMSLMDSSDSELSEASQYDAINLDSEEQKRYKKLVKKIGELEDEYGAHALDAWANTQYRPETRLKIPTGKIVRNNGAGMSGYIKIIDRGNPLLYKRY